MQGMLSSHEGQARRPTIVVDPNPMNEILKRAEQLRRETSDGAVYPCGQCQKVFKFKYEYERHAKIHSGDRPWQCSECLKTFSRKDNMRAHMKIHTGELVRHECGLCGKSYGRKYDLQVHERVHSGERPFLCASCGKCFISTSRLRAHQLIHCKNIYLPRHVRNKQQPPPPASLVESPDSPEFVEVDDVDVKPPMPTPPPPPPPPPPHSTAAADSDSPADSPDCSRQFVQPPAAGDGDEDDEPVCLIDIEKKMQQLEAALMQRKAELARRGIKVEVDDMLGLDSHLRDEARIHVVLPEAVKAEVDCFADP